MNVFGGAGAGDAATVGPADAGQEGDGEPEIALALDPDPSAARQARAWVTEVLAGWPEERVDRARLLVSELVTNAVLHARTEISLRCRRVGQHARFEVGDRHRGGPTPKRYVADSPTGRGVRLVASLAEGWGVERTRSAKIVWFELARDVPETGTSAEAGQVTTGDPLSLIDLEMLAEVMGDASTPPPDSPSDGPPGGPGGGTSAMGRVRILQLPLEIYLEAEQHNDAVIRELDLIERSPRRGPQVPPRLLELATSLRLLFSAATTSTRAQVDEALRAGRACVDLDVDVPAEGWEVLMEMARHLDEVDRYCREGVLLTLAASPRQRRFRHWYATQVAQQMQGHLPTPWPDDDV